MTSAGVAPLTVGDATLRMLTADDLPLTRAWRNHPDSRSGFHVSDEIGDEQHRAWFENYLRRDDDYVFVMEVAGRPAAQAALYDIADGAAEFGRLVVDPATRGVGLSHRVIDLTLAIADDTLDLAEVHLEVKPENARAIAAYERAGFVHDASAVGQHGSLVMRRTRP